MAVDELGLEIGREGDKIAEALAAPFPESALEWRVLRSGVKNDRPWAQVVPFVDARAVRARLTEVMGLDGWQTNLQPVEGGVICNLGLRFGDEWIWKADGSDYTAVEAFKGGVSSSLRRAAVSFGVGEYLYHLDMLWADFVVGGAHKDEIKEKGQDKGKWLTWNPPKLPAWAHLV